MVVIEMEKVRSSEDLMEYITNMDRENSVGQFFIPGKGQFTIVLQEEDHGSIAADVRRNPELRQMINDSLKAYGEGRTMSTSELIRSLSHKDFSE
jgi:hypothetical protein